MEPGTPPTKGNGYYLFVSQLELLSYQQWQQYFFVTLKTSVSLDLVYLFARLKKIL